MRNQLLREKTCDICGGKSTIDGIMIRNKLICSDCEKKIVNSNTNDKEYTFYKDKVKKILFK